MTLRAALFTDEYEALGALTGQTREELIAEHGLHEGPRELWLAWDGDRVVGLMQPWLRPDGRRTLYFGPCDAAAYPLLADRVPGEAITMVDGAERERLAALTAAGFAPLRTEDRYSIPIRPLDAPVPAGLRLISAADTELERLMALDCALREDVPGADGWQPDPDWFREETYESPFFDPATYLVALDGERYVGLVRIWIGPRPQPRLGLIAVLPDYRRRGLARALVSQAFAPLVARGETEAIAEADRGNEASTTLLAQLGAVVTGSDVELHRAAR
jgi:GNAT superfamily N-acetyltransferase